MQVTYIYNLLVYKWSKELIELNTQIFKLVLILIEDKKATYIHVPSHVIMPHKSSIRSRHD